MKQDARRRTQLEKKGTTQICFGLIRSRSEVLEASYELLMGAYVLEEKEDTNLLWPLLA